MARYKEVEPLEIVTWESASEEFDKGVIFILEKLDALPTADVVEVVRCKDCKHATFYRCKNDPCYNSINCEYRIGIGDENFFCSYGEKRTETYACGKE